MAPAGEFWARWRVRLGYPVALVCFLLSQPTRGSLAIGAGIAAGGVVLRAAAAGYLRKGKELATSGPYAYTRNPLYLGSALLAGGFGVASRSWPVAIVLAVYFVLVYAAVMRREEEELRAQYGAAFDDYAARVPLFLPRLKSRATGSSRGGRRFSWSFYRRNREYEAALGFLVGVALLGLWMRLRG